MFEMMAQASKYPKNIMFNFNEYRNKVSTGFRNHVNDANYRPRQHRRRNYLSVHLKLTGIPPLDCRCKIFIPVATCSFFFFFRNGRQPTDGEEQQFPEEYPDLRGSSRISNKFSAKHVTNEFRAEGGRGKESTARIYTIVENFNYLTAHNPVMTRDTYTYLLHSLSLSFAISPLIIFLSESGQILPRH